jgi:membrane-associated phospholipid phosphatase
MVDIVSAFAFVGLYAFFARRHRGEQLDRTVARGILLTGMVLASKQIAEALAMLIDRDSPTLVHPDAVRLSELVPAIPTKDVGYVVFPGDHATILLVCAGVLTFYLPRRYAVVAWIAAVVFSVPRLVGGGHWLTDDIVGAAAVAGFMHTYVFATPVHRVITDRIERSIAKIRAKTSTF